MSKKAEKRAMETKPFNLEEAKAGAKVVTREGRPARIICWDAKLNLNRHIVALVTMDNGDELTNRYNNYGECLGVPTKESPSDLLLLLEPKPKLTEFEKALVDFGEHQNWDGNKTYVDNARMLAPKLLAIAKEELLKDLPKWRKKVDWISVKTPPKESGWYFTCVEVNGVPQCLGVDYYYVITKEWGDDDDDITNVDYWMPIPELPKGGEK